MPEDPINIILTSPTTHKVSIELGRVAYYALGAVIGYKLGKWRMSDRCVQAFGK